MACRSKKNPIERELELISDLLDNRMNHSSSHKKTQSQKSKVKRNLKQSKHIIQNGKSSLQRRQES